MGQSARVGAEQQRLAQLCKNDMDTDWQISPCVSPGSSGAVDGGYLRGDSSCELQVSAHTGPGSPRPPDPHMTAGTSTAVSPHTPHMLDMDRIRF